MIISPPPPREDEQERSPLRENDWRLLLQLVPYARRSGRLFLISMLLLVPLSVSGAIQPLIIGQAISLIRQEKTWSFIQGRSLTDGLGILTFILLLTIAVRLVFVSVQGYLVQKV